MLSGNLGPAVMRRVAHALQILVPFPEQEYEFQVAAQAIQNEEIEIEEQSSKAQLGHIDTRGLLSSDSNAVAMMLVAVSETKLHPHLAGIKARRYLAVLVLEIVLRTPDMVTDTSVVNLARVVRLELTELEKDDASRPAIPDPESLLDLINWIDSRPQKSERFPQYFWNSWRKYLSPAALEILETPILSNDESPEEDNDFQIRPVLSDSHATSENDTSVQVRGLIPAEASTPLEENRSVGLQRIICEALLSTQTPINKLTSNSTSVYTDSEVKVKVIKLLESVDRCILENDIESANALMGKLLMVSTGTSQNHLPFMQWMNIEDNPPIASGISLNAEWLLRREYIPVGAARPSDASEKRIVWIPIPVAIQKRLLKLHPKPKAGTVVLSALRSSTAKITGLPIADDTSLRRTFISKIARLEPLGFTGAQWATGENLGIDDAPLFYDRYPADRFSTLVEKAIFPWFGESPGRPRQNRPLHQLGSRITTNSQLLSSYNSRIHRNVPTSDELESVVTRLKLRVENVVHGLIAVTGHRPNNAIRKLTILQFDLVDKIAILSDKAVDPGWQHRPVALPGKICSELASMIHELNLIAKLSPGTELGMAAKNALQGKSSLFLKIRSKDEVYPFGIEDYFESMPDELTTNPNFARHALNQMLIGRVPEALRVGQMGWHGDREGAWADISPWSVRTASKLLEEHLALHLKNIGWRPIKCVTAALETNQPVSLCWISREEAHRKKFGSKLNQLRASAAVNQREVAHEMLPNIQKLVSSKWPRIRLNDKFVIEWSDVPTSENPAICVEAKDFTKLASMLIPGNPRSQKRMIAQNILSLAFRVARKKGMVEGAIPQRIHWSFGHRPGMFLEASPSALSVGRKLRTWALSEKTNLSLAARTAVVLTLFSGYGDSSVALRAMQRNNSLSRSRKLPDIVLLEDCFNNNTFAFHGIAALFLQKWFRNSQATLLDEEKINAELLAALPKDWIATSDRNLLSEFAAVARAQNSLTMDGMARLVGTGKVVMTTVNAMRIVSSHDHHQPITFTTKATEALPQVQSTYKSGARISNVITLTAAMSSSLPNRKEKYVGEVESRKKLRSQLTESLKRHKGQPNTLDLLVRYAVSLLDEGGKRKPELRLETIRSYIGGIAHSLCKRLGDEPMQKGDSHWQEAFIQVIASTTPEMRINRFNSLRRFHDALSEHMDLPSVDFAELSKVVGEQFSMVSAGFLTAPEITKAIECLSSDMNYLIENEAPAKEIHLARARLLYFSLLCSTSLRPGEAWSLLARNVVMDDEVAKVAVTKHKFQKLKTLGARRRPALTGSIEKIAFNLLNEWLVDLQKRTGSNFNSLLPLFGELEDPTVIIDRELIFNRVNTVVKWVTNNNDAVQYWTRKTGAMNSINALNESEETSLWLARDMLSRIGHQDVRTTIAHYLHDPSVIFCRWFNHDIENASTFDSSWLSIATGRSSSRINRKRAKECIRGGRVKDIRKRIGELLIGIKYSEPMKGSWILPLPVATEKTFEATADEIDLILRAICDGSDVEKIVRARSWPKGAATKLNTAMQILSDDYKISIGGEGVNRDFIAISPPRRVSTNGVSTNGVHPLISTDIKICEDAFVQFCDSWLRVATMRGVPAGIPATKSEWANWDLKLEISADEGWVVQQFGALEFRIPPTMPGSKTSGWPTIRWQMLITWIAAKLKESRGTGALMTSKEAF